MGTESQWLPEQLCQPVHPKTTPKTKSNRPQILAGSSTGRTLTRGTKMMRMRIMGCLLRAASLRSFSTAAHTSEGTALKCLSEAIKNNNFKAVEKIIYEQVSGFLCPFKKDPYEVRRVKMPAYTTEEEPNLIASSAPTRLIGCLCEPEANAINWMEISKGPPKKCYCGHWFKLVDFEEYLDKSSD
nr:unnamed protein product [Spirometra erinaceieuropaei]